MNRTRSSLSLAAALAVVLALALAPAASAGAPADAGSAPAQTSAKRGGKKKASKCTKRRAASKGKRGKTRRGVVAESSARGKGGKGGKGKRAKRCPAKRSTPKRDSGSGRRDRPSRDPRERRREREEAKGHGRPPHPTRPAPRAPPTVVPADGTYTSAGAPGLTFAISGDGTRGRVVYTVPKTDFDEALCQTQDIAVDVPVELSRSTGRSGVTGNAQLPGDVTVSILGSVAADGSFTITLSTLRPYVPNPGSTCAASSLLQGTLAR